MILVLDATALLASLANEPARALVEVELRNPATDVRISSVNMGEIVDVLMRRAALSKEAVDERIELLKASGLTVAGVSEEVGRLGGRLRGRHWDKRTCAVSLADCIALALALTLNGRLATSDRALYSVARIEGGDLLALPDSTGARPENA